MWIVRLALRRPYTFVVMALLIMILGPLAILRTPTDIFPSIDIPVVAVLWNYNGLNAEEMEQRITSGYERILTTVVNDIVYRAEECRMPMQCGFAIFLVPLGVEKQIFRKQQLLDLLGVVLDTIRDGECMIV